MFRRTARMGANAMMQTSKLTLRVEFGDGRALGPGKIRLLEAIERTGSISQAGRDLGMAYRRAWQLVDDMNRCFSDPVIDTTTGGPQGGGAILTPFGKKLIKQYRAIEDQALDATQQLLREIEPALKDAKVGRPLKSIKGSLLRNAPERS
jgi:molybdate transport system regulatory protein